MKRRPIQARLQARSQRPTPGDSGSGLIEVITALANDQQLTGKRRDHQIIGEWKDHRDLHIKPGLVLIYRKPDAERLQLVRLGSHSELGL